MSFTPQDQVDITWISDTMFVFYGNEAVPFIGNAITDPVQPGWIWTGREHVFRSRNYGLNPGFPRDDVLEHCNIWTGDGDIDENGIYEPTIDICDDFQPLGDPGAERPADRSPASAATARAVTSRSSSAGRTTPPRCGRRRAPVGSSSRRTPMPPSRRRCSSCALDSLAANDPPRYPTAIFVDPEDSNHAWMTYSGFNAKTPDTPGHVFEIRYVPASGGNPATVAFTNLDGDREQRLPATSRRRSIIVSAKGTIYVAQRLRRRREARTRSGKWHRRRPVCRT